MLVLRFPYGQARQTFDRNSLSLPLEESYHLSKLSFLVHENGIPANRFGSSVISFNSVLCFSVCTSYTLLLKCILKYLLLFNSI